MRISPTWVQALVAWLDNLTWKCDICGAERSNGEIKVLTYPLSGFPKGTAKRNLRYCADDEGCHEGALEKAETNEY
jgi:hypothetical protein